MSVFTDKMAAQGVDLDTAKAWENELLQKLNKAQQRRDSAGGSIAAMEQQKQDAIAEIEKIKTALGILP